MNGGEVLALFGAPEREDSLRAVSLALLRVRANGATCKEIARAIDCSSDTVEAASNERSMLGFDSIARLAHRYPETRPFLCELWDMGAAAESDPLERIATAQEEIRKALAEIERAAA